MGTFVWGLFMEVTKKGATSHIFASKACALVTSPPYCLLVLFLSFRVTDMAWSPNPHQDWSLLSADDSGEVHFWQIVISRLHSCSVLFPSSFHSCSVLFPSSFHSCSVLFPSSFHLLSFTSFDICVSQKTSPIFWM